MSRLHTKRLARRTQSRGESWWTQRCWSARCCDPVRSCNSAQLPSVAPTPPRFVHFGHFGSYLTSSQLGLSLQVYKFDETIKTIIPVDPTQPPNTKRDPLIVRKDKEKRSV